MREILQNIHAFKDLYHAGDAPLWIRGLAFGWQAAQPLLTPLLFVTVAGVMYFEWKMPAVREQRRVSKGFRHDLFWFIGDRAVWLGALALLGSGVTGFYQSYLSFLTIDIASHLPAAASIAVVLLVNDFVFWFVHYLKHKVWWLWVFHAVHHSQPEMNLFTDFRVHAGERALNMILLFIPMNMFQIALPTMFYVAVFLDWYRVVYHANIRANYGPLKYALVTPQFHRIHHSVETRHADTNFGLIFTFWDRMFGSHWGNYDEYPRTGISDGSFPLEQSAGSTVVGTWLRQTAHPVLRLVGRRQSTNETAAETAYSRVPHRGTEKSGNVA